MIRYLLDTNACIGIIRGIPPLLRQRLLEITPGKIAHLQIVLYVWKVGVFLIQSSVTKLDQSKALLVPCLCAGLREDQATMAANVRRPISKGTPIGPLDTLIAAHALSLDAILVTHNVGEFLRVYGLRLEDWESP